MNPFLAIFHYIPKTIGPCFGLKQVIYEYTAFGELFSDVLDVLWQLYHFVSVLIID